MNGKIYDLKIIKERIDQSDYMDTIAHLTDKKMDTLKDKNTFVRKKKVVDYLLRKGYESELVWSYVHKL